MEIKTRTAVRVLQKALSKYFNFKLATRFIRQPFGIDTIEESVTNAAIVSHGAQRARELGIGAIGGVRTSRLETGLFVEIDPYNGKIVNLSMKET